MKIKVLLVVLLLLLPLSVFAGTCDCDISQDKVEAYNALLNLDSEEQAAATSTHLPWGIPTSPETATNEHLLHQADYILNYDDDLKTSIWAAYRLRAEDVAVERGRVECFRNDPRLGDEDAAFCFDYDEPVYDRGHLAPSTAMTRSESAMINTYMFSNMAPQHNKFNRVIWKRLEGYVRDWAKVKGEIYVITGAVFDRDNDGKRDPDDQAEHIKAGSTVAVPSHFYKIILHETPNTSIETMTFLLPHNNDRHVGHEADEYLTSRLISIDEIETLTGMDFLPVLGVEHPSEEITVEGSVAERMWGRK